MSGSEQNINGSGHGSEQGANARNQNRADFKARWERLYRMFDLDPWDTKSDIQFAKIIGKTRQAIQHGRANQEIPALWLVELASKFSVSMDYVYHGIGSPYLDIPEDKSGMGAKPIDESSNRAEPQARREPAAARPQPQAEVRDFRISDAIAMTAQVLESGTSYATALYLNIQHFHRAITAEERITQLEKTLAAMQEQIDNLKKHMQAIEQAKNAEPQPVPENGPLRQAG